MTLRIPEKFLSEIETAGRAASPREVCGLLAGVDTGRLDEPKRIVSRILPIENDDIGHRTYLLNAKQQLAAEREAAHADLKILGVYHTHPVSSAWPSETDVTQAHWEGTDDLLYPDYSWLIVSLESPDHIDARSFSITGKRRPEDINEERVEITG